MARTSIHMEIDQKDIDRIGKELEKFINLATQEVIEEEKSVMQSIVEQTVPTFADSGILQEVFEKTNLEGVAIRQNRLKEAIAETVNDIHVDMRYNSNNMMINVFNNNRLQEKTKWIGLSRKPMIISKNNKITFYDKDNYPMYDDSAVLPNAHEGKTFSKIEGGVAQPAEWESNPYPGYGYWASTDEGWVSPRTGFINSIYSRMLTGNLTATRFEPTGFQPHIVSRIAEKVKSI